MKVAFYRGTQRGLTGIMDRLIRFWTRGDYSHCELVFDNTAAGETSLCASSSFMDGGVRFKFINLDTPDWVLVDVPILSGAEGAAAREAKQWFVLNGGKPYDVRGVFGFVLRPISPDRSRYFCSEAVALALGFKEAWRFDPNTFAAVLSRR